ncbi:high affinity methionine permease [Fusarium beomiforme]|uniref:High affinity methionine permease n=1 Tax=Fusarium beomiforme TaxID=44412 RepID=A0A9P5E2H0_9HYPO|nr:high affinity methionine permease [Fusarium beomiforme]
MGLPFKRKPQVTSQTVPEHPQSDSEASIIRDGDLAYVRQTAGNGASGYQEAVGAPVETRSPLGYHVNWLTIIFLNLNHMVGTGIFSTPATILRLTGSIGLALVYWVIGFLLAVAGLAVHMEFTSYFPNRSGSEVVWLEQGFPRPKHLFPVAFAVQSVLLSFSSSNAIVLSNYLWRIVGRTPDPWELKGVAIAAYTLAVIVVIAHNRYSLWAINIIGALKLLLLLFIAISGLVILGGHFGRIEDPGINFRNGFQGTTSSGYSLSQAMVNITFAFSGWQNAFSMANEIKNPIPTLKKNATASLLIVFSLYFLCNIAYFAAVPKDIFLESKELAAAVFFRTAFGSSAESALNFCVLLSSFGNLLAVLISQSRQIREIARQGVLPWTEFWVSTKPFGTPIGPYLLKWGFTFLMIVAPPAGDAFQFVVSLKTYPDAIFHAAMGVGLLLIRRRRSRSGTPRSDFRAWWALVILYLLAQVFLLVMPWIPPEGGIYAGTVSFLWCTYMIVGIGIMAICGIYYYLWMKVFPRWGNYSIRSQVVSVDDNGANTHRLLRSRKMPLPPPPPPPSFRAVTANALAAHPPPPVPEKGPADSLLLELIKHNGAPFNDHWAYFIKSSSNPGVGIVYEAIGDVRNGFQLQVRRNHDLTCDPPSTQIPLQRIDSTFVDEKSMLLSENPIPVCRFEKSLYKVKVPEKTLNNTTETEAPKKRIVQRNCQTWIVESADQLVADGIVSPDVAAYLYATKQV